MPGPVRGPQDTDKRVQAPSATRGPPWGSHTAQTIRPAAWRRPFRVPCPPGTRATPLHSCQWRFPAQRGVSGVASIAPNKSHYGLVRRLVPQPKEAGTLNLYFGCIKSSVWARSCTLRPWTARMGSLASSLGRETAGEAQIMMFQATNEGFRCSRSGRRPTAKTGRLEKFRLSLASVVIL